ncbi:helicase-associated domain-containing protein [Labedaea rhizosphaerae]|uniref:helicase-associated domain-containing protein n=1 Tax=Labedaea rhizosphaerae TaxID=598644 RepID=UPI001060729B|nr:helicase-associated domain-containing protein [Labedaea rhizosphaerae]
MPALTLIDWLRQQDDEALATLLQARPDLATPPPADTGVLAARAATRASLARVAEQLDAFTLAVLDALLVADADHEPVPLTEVAALLGTGVPADRVAAAVHRLRELAVVWGADETLSLVPAAREAGTAFPGGLGAPSPELDRVDLQARLSTLDEPERHMLTALAQGSPIGRTKDAARVVPLDEARTPVQRLLALGLLVRRDAETVELPRQVGLALRSPDSPLGTVPVDEPAMGVKKHDPDRVDATGAGEAMELVRRMESLLALWSAEPPPVLKSGGLGVRDVRRLAREVETDEPTATFLAELAAGAGLVADSEALSPEWVPTTQADVWLVSSQANRWAALAAAWLELPRLPGLAGRRDDKQRLLAPLSDELRRPAAAIERANVLEVLADQPVGAGVAEPDDVADVLAWRAPRRGSSRFRDDLVRWTFTEATALGVIALGALTSPGRALLLDGSTDAAKRMQAAMPAPLDHVLVQADLTIVAPGPLQADLAAMINQLADVESAGSATVYRVSEESVRRALDAGRTATELHELLRTRSRTPVPQGLTYLIDDVARRHGRLRAGSALSFLRCDDEVLLTEVLTHASAARLELRRIAPTVAVSPVPLADVLDELRSAGFTPAAEGPEGEIVDLRGPGRRIPARPRRKLPAPRVASRERLLEIVRDLRSHDTAAGIRRGRTVALAGGAGADTSQTLALLQEAVRSGQDVWIGFVDSHGVASQRVIRPERVGGGLFVGRDRAHGETHRFPLHRITTASLVDPA